ncbi:succinyldiaminopimelate transaminase [Chitinimonas arctica]|uniref:Putative 8-amino-7-oxononanoate synthase n=1 Tax=Chitinimonas arctica TaxID=2594795 RepID=A0A516SC35_9NEIS|nr:succinyldiaminopimelate transaminase [Chitinimonas arctica]QDQ25703.1 succinyldiaminopimelate transaminase [Chitinimonas arctica]
MNPLLDSLQPYPFQRLKALLADARPTTALRHIDLSIGEPKHPTPPLIMAALQANFAGLAQYPATQGTPELRGAIADWLAARYGIPRPDAAREVLPVNGSREALFSFVQAMVDSRGEDKPVVISPNPFYQIYEGAALLAGAEPYYLDCRPALDMQPDWAQVPETVWRRTQLVFVCSPGNPTGAVMSLEDWRQLFELSDRHGFIIASDECYSEIWFDTPPLGGLQAAQQLGRDYSRLVVFSSLSKRSNAPGMRSGFVAGDAALLAGYLLYRTYHGSAMSAMVQAASAAAWRDESHVEANRDQYRAKFDAVVPLLAEPLAAGWPDAAFYLWTRIPARFGQDDAAFCRALFETCHVTVLPGSYLGRAAHADNPGAGRIRIALVAPLEDCVEGARRIAEFCA